MDTREQMMTSGGSDGPTASSGGGMRDTMYFVEAQNGAGALLSFGKKRMKVRCVPWGEDTVTMGAETLTIKRTSGPCHPRGCPGNAGSSTSSADYVDLSASKLTYVSLIYNEASRLSLATGIGKIAGVLLFFYIVRDSVGLDGWEGSDFRLLLLLACAAFMVVWYFFMRSTRAVSFAPARAAHLRCSAQAAFLAFAGLRGGRSHRHRDE